MDVDRLRELLAKATPGEWFNAYSVILSNHVDTRFNSIASFVGKENAEANIEIACAAVNALPSLLAHIAKQDAEIAGLRELRNAAEAKYRYALVLIDAADDEDAGMAGVAYSAQVPCHLVESLSASQLAELMCDDAAIDALAQEGT